MLQIVETGAGMATYQFLPGFVVSHPQSKAFTVSHLKPGITTVSLMGRSLSLLEQVSVGGSMPEAMRCTELYFSTSSIKDCLEKQPSPYESTLRVETTTL